MIDAHEFLQNFALVLGVAAVMTVVFERLRQPVVFGYILAGLIIGPYVPIPLVADSQTVHTLSELGVIMLMFSLGLEFSIRRLVQAGWTIVVVAVLQSSLMVWLGFEAGRLLGWSTLASLYAGAAIAISSTTIIVKAMADQRVRGGFKDLVFGILIVEDLIAIVLLALLTPASTGAAGGAGSLGWTIVRLAGVLAGVLAAGMLLVPRFVRFVVRLGRPEIALLVAVGVCFGIAVLVQRIGYSVALGAFLAGSLVAESGEEKVIERLVEPVRDMFAAIFFVSVGMMIDPAVVARHWVAVLGFTALVVAGKIVGVSAATFLTGAGVRTSVQTGMSLAQIGEFSFIIAAAGLASGVTPPALYPIMIAVSAITTLTTPWLIRSADPAAAWLDRHLPRPLQTFAALYGTWLENVRSRPETSAGRRRIQRAARGLALDAAVILALCIGARFAARPLGARLAERLALDPFQAQALVVGAAIVAAIPFVAGIVRTGRALGIALAQRAFVDPEPGRLDPAAAPRRALIVVVQLATLALVGIAMIAATQPFLPRYVGPVLFASGLLLLAVIVWRTAADLQGHVKAASEVIVSALGRRAESPVDANAGEQNLKRAYQLVPGLGDPIPVTIESGSPFVGRTLSEVELRGRTGATIVAISRGDEVVLVPDGHETLRAGDVVALAGTRTAIEAARDLLRGREPPVL